MAHELKILISGGGTGGHIFPAIAIANYLRDNCGPCEIQFVGALGRMEMEKVPQAGYPIIGLPVAGLNRKWTMSNLLLPVKVCSSVLSALRIIKTFKPHVAVGVGGYASGPAMMAAVLSGVPLVLQEQNGYAGITNKWLGKYAKKICVAYPDMDRFFESRKIVVTGNPVRREIYAKEISKDAAEEYFELTSSKKVLLVLGGSLGARTINNSIAKALPMLQEHGITVIWQCGKNYYQGLKDIAHQYANVKLMPFITDMSMAYTVADIIVSRAGALSISELCIAGKPAILVPSPNVAEDHQRHNAMALVIESAALMVNDNEAEEKLTNMVLGLMQDDSLRKELTMNIAKLAKPDADREIVEQILSVIKR